jgi:hypothetical protein
MKLVLTLLAVCVCDASAIACLPQFCANIRCYELSPETCVAENSVYKPNATFCGCCPDCIRQLGMIIIGVTVIITIVSNINNF